VQKDCKQNDTTDKGKISKHLVKVVNKVRGKNGSFRDKGEFIAKTRINSRGYVQVSLNIDNKMRPMSLHRLVAKMFIPNPENLPEVNHNDGDKTNNRKSNWEWSTRKDNMKHARENGLFPEDHNKGVKHGRSKLNPKQIVNIRELKNNGKTYKFIAEKYDVSIGCIQGIIRKDNWSHV